MVKQAEKGKETFSFRLCASIPINSKLWSNFLWCFVALTFLSGPCVRMFLFANVLLTPNTVAKSHYFLWLDTFSLWFSLSSARYSLDEQSASHDEPEPLPSSSFHSEFQQYNPTGCVVHIAEHDMLDSRMQQKQFCSLFRWSTTTSKFINCDMRESTQLSRKLQFTN